MSKTARAHTNIALIKYWGKKDAKLRLPLMSSLSMTLDAFYSDTKISDSEQMSFKLNGQAVSGPAADRERCLRDSPADLRQGRGGEVRPTPAAAPCSARWMPAVRRCTARLSTLRPTSV